MHLSTYLFFTTTCEQALKFYAECDLGKIVSSVKYEDGGASVINPIMRGKIMHAQFEGPGVRFFASDNDDAEPMKGSALIFWLDDRDQTKLLFDRLAYRGSVTTPLGLQPWGDYYGKLTDQFGVQWMFNCTAKSSSVDN
jgi:PhnB protein